MQLECKSKDKKLTLTATIGWKTEQTRFQAVLKYFWSIETVVKDRNKFCALPSLMSITQNIIVYYRNNFPIENLINDLMT